MRRTQGADLTVTMEADSPEELVDQDGAARATESPQVPRGEPLLPRLTNRLTSVANDPPALVEEPERRVRNNPYKAVPLFADTNAGSRHLATHGSSFLQLVHGSSDAALSRFPRDRFVPMMQFYWPSTKEEVCGALGTRRMPPTARDLCNLPDARGRFVCELHGCEGIVDQRDTQPSGARKLRLEVADLDFLAIALKAGVLKRFMCGQMPDVCIKRIAMTLADLTGVSTACQELRGHASKNNSTLILSDKLHGPVMMVERTWSRGSAVHFVAVLPQSAGELEGLDGRVLWHRGFVSLHETPFNANLPLQGWHADVSWYCAKLDWRYPPSKPPRPRKPSMPMTVSSALPVK